MVPCNLLASSPQMDIIQERTSRYLVGHHPLVCLHLITTSEMQPYFNILQYCSPPEKLILQSVIIVIISATSWCCTVVNVYSFHHNV